MDRFMAYLKRNWFFSFCGMIFLASLLVFPRFFDFLEPEYAQQIDVSWFFITSDIQQCLGALLGLLICLLVIAVNHFKSPERTPTYILFTVLWFGMFLGHGLILLGHLTSWESTSVASADTLEGISSGHFWKRIVLYVYLFLIFLASWYIRKKETLKEE